MTILVYVMFDILVKTIFLTAELPVGCFGSVEDRRLQS